MKKIITLLLTLTMIFVFAACENGNKDNTSTGSKPASSQSGDENSTETPQNPDVDDNETDDTETDEPIIEDPGEVDTSHTHVLITKITQEATCAAEGVKTTTCEGCTYKSTETIAKLAHSYKYSKDKTPTETATGSIKGVCEKCSDTTTVTIPKLTTADYSKTVTKVATCTTTGIDTWTLKTTTYGTFSYTVTIAAKGHDLKTSGSTTMTISCSSCNLKITQANNTFDYWGIGDTAYWKDGKLYVQFILVNTNDKAIKVTSMNNMYFDNSSKKRLTRVLNWENPDIIVNANSIHTHTLIIAEKDVQNYGAELTGVGMYAEIKGTFI